jgi:outer membrane lipoprotein-sorting protein
MKSRRFATLAVLATLAALVLAGAASAESLDEILARNYETKGGLQKLQAVRTARMTGKMMMGQGMEAPFVLLWARPDKVRTEFTFQGMTGIQAYDGAVGWQVMPFLGKTEPETMGEEELKSVREMGEDALEGPLVGWREKGHTVELAGEEEIEGTPAWRLRVTKKNGDVSTVWLDKESALEFKAEGKRTVRGQEMEFESSIGDYKEVGGLLLAHSIESRPKGAPQGQVILIEAIELDSEIPDGTFTMPPPKPAAAAPAAGG